MAATRDNSRPDLHEVLPAGCVELHALTLHAATDAEGKTTAPEWVHIVPAGELDKESGEVVVRGRDGRRFVIDSHEAVIAGTELPMQFDWEHLSMYGVWGGGERSSRAAGWIDRLEWLEKADAHRTEPGLWGHVSRWTPDGRADVEQGYYRGLSPVVRHQNREPAVEGEDPPPPLLRGLVNVALTNRPNLRMALLHAEEHASKGSIMTEEEKALRTRLGLPETATHAEVARAVQAHLATLVPRAELELAHARVQAAEAPRAALAKRLGIAHDATVDVVLNTALAALVKGDKDAHEAAVDSVLEQARTAGKVPPAALEHYRAMCADAAGLKRVQAIFAALPASIVADDQHGDANPPGPQGTLTPQQREIAHSMGLTDEEYLAALKLNS